MQKFYACEQCNRSWKTSVEGAKVNMKICEPCIFRCHDGHKGIRYLKDLEAVCLCQQICAVSMCKCNAQEIATSQQLCQSEAQDRMVEMSRRREQDSLMPPVFAMVPNHLPTGEKKKISGWQLCRRPPFDGFNKMGSILGLDENSSIATADTSHTSKTGSFYKGAPVDYDIQTELLEADEYPWDPPPGLPEGWIEVVDPEEPEEVREYANM